MGRLKVCRSSKVRTGLDHEAFLLGTSYNLFPSREVSRHNCEGPYLFTTFTTNPSPNRNQISTRSSSVKIHRSHTLRAFLSVVSPDSDDRLILMQTSSSNNHPMQFHRFKPLPLLCETSCRSRMATNDSNPSYHSATENTKCCPWLSSLHIRNTAVFRRLFYGHTTGEVQDLCCWSA